MEKITQKIQKISQDLISRLDEEAQISVKKEDDIYHIQIDTEPSGMFIGYHGENLFSLQTIISLMVKKSLGQDIRVSINVGDYLEKRFSQLEKIAESAVEKVRQTSQSYTLPNLNAKERRYIHMFLSEMKDIKTESIGEGGERRLVIFPQI